MIGDDEIVARHCRHQHHARQARDVYLSAAFMTLTGAMMAPRWTYIDPAIAFNPDDLLPGRRSWRCSAAPALLFGPLLGAVPLVLLFEFLTRELSELLLHPARLRLHADRLCAAARRRRTVQAMAARDASKPADAPHEAPGACCRCDGLRAFGGLVAVDDISLRRCARRDRRPDRPQRLRQDDRAQSDLWRAEPDTGTSA
ncbi:MAG: hypothetical protein QM737_23895 [Ferruginibacter sp.]